MDKKVSVTLYTVPQQACCMGKMDWTQAGQMLQHYLHMARQLFEQPLFAIPLLEQEIIGHNRIDALRRALFGLPAGEALAH